MPFNPPPQSVKLSVQLATFTTGETAYVYMLFVNNQYVLSDARFKTVEEALLDAATRFKE